MSFGSRVVVWLCGCVAKILGKGTSARIDSRSPSRDEAILATLKLPPAHEPVYAAFLQTLDEALARDETAFADKLSQIAHICLQRFGELSHLQTLLLAMFQTLPATTSNTVLKQAGEQLLGGQIVLTNATNVYKVSETDLEDASDFLFRELNYIKNRMSGSNNAEMLDLVEKAMLEFRIPTAYIALFDAPFSYNSWRESTLPTHSRLIFAMKDYVRKHEGLNIPFLTQHWVNDSLFDAAECCVLVPFPIYQNRQHYGYIIFDLSEMPTCRLETLRDEISTNVINGLMTAELSSARDHLRMELEVAAQLNARLVQLAGRDDLTGLYNRRGFFSMARQQIGAEKGFPMMIIFVDLDGLKAINDTYGHQEGDFAIRKAADLLMEIFRTVDVVSRLGGDEFVILSQSCTPKDLRSIKGRVYTHFSAFNAEGSKPYRVECSLGYYVLEASDTTSLEEILGLAGQCLYEEKRLRRTERERMRLSHSSAGAAL